MQPFELPDFYVPWPARLNPNLDAARVHSKAWAQEMGILNTSEHESNPKVWNEHEFDAHDYALFCAYLHPEAPSSELNLMTEWNVWGFYVDDYFLQVYKQSKNHAGAREYLNRVLLFMPIDLSHLPTPANQIERGLADLWLRTAPTKSEAWRSRIIEDMKSLWDAFLWELENMGEQRLANPIEYIAMRRQVGAALWSADLVEHAVFVEVPDRIAASRAMLTLKNTFADAAHLRNDIFSYEREVIKQGELTNAVLVVERFLGVNTQRAVNLVNDLLTSRLQRFEHVIVTELAQLFEEYQLDGLEQAHTLTYIRGLQDWQSGAHEWHIQTSRYLNPGAKQAAPTLGSFLRPSAPKLGSSALRLTPDSLGFQRFKNYMHIPYKTVGPTLLPKFYMPFTTQMSPHLDAARRNSKAWARQMGMLDALPGHSDIFIFDENRFDGIDLAFFCALAHPDKTAAQLDMEMYWLTLGTYTDDYLPAVYGRTRDITGAKMCVARLSEFMPLDLTTPTPVPMTPIERGLADIWPRTAAPLSVNERGLFRKVVEDMIGSWVWEIADRIQNRIPDPIDYIEMRRITSGSDQLLLLSRSMYGQGVPPEVHRTLIMQELNNSAIDYVCLTNDIFSYQKEIEFDGEIHNGVLVIENFLGCDRMQAVEIVNNLMTARMKQFEHIVKNEIPVLFENFNLDTKARKQLLGYVEELQRYMCSSLQWHIKTSRYKESEFRRSADPFIGIRPAGLGTTAAHIQAAISGTSAAESQTQAETPNPAKTFAVSHLEPFFIKKKEEVQSD